MKSKLQFMYELGDNAGGEYPEDCKLTLEFSGDATLDQVFTAFRMFLKGVEYSETLIEAYIQE